MSPTSRCPICNEPTDKAYKPFCSKRCADVDLNRWLSGSYAIPGEPAAPEDLSAADRAEADQSGNDDR